jgi:hypothetical protein
MKYRTEVDGVKRVFPLPNWTAIIACGMLSNSMQMPYKSNYSMRMACACYEEKCGLLNKNQLNSWNSMHSEMACACYYIYEHSSSKQHAFRNSMYKCACCYYSRRRQFKITCTQK